MSEESKNLYNEAIDAIEAGDLPAAITKIEESLTADPKDDESYRLYAQLLQAAGRADDAAKALEKADSITDNPVEKIKMQATQAAASGDHARAITLYEDALGLAPDRYDLHLSYALSLLESGYSEDALSASAKAVELEQEDAQAWYLRGRILRLNKQIEPALEAFDKSVKINDSLPVVWHERGMVLNELNKQDAAIKSFERVLKIVPNDPAAAQAKASIIQSMMG